MLNRFEMDIIFSISGIPAPVSHFVTACLDTPIFSAKSSCDIPTCLRMDFNFLANVMLYALLYIL